MGEVVRGNSISTAPSNIYLSESEYLEAKEIGEKLVKMFPPEEYVIFGIGRSPTAVMAYLQTRYPGIAYNVPLSGAVVRSKLDDQRQSRLDAHFDRFIPSSEVVGSKKVVVFDYISSGGSLINGRSYIREYLQKHGRNSETHIAGMQNMESELSVEYLQKNLSQYGIQDLTVIPLREHLADKLNKRGYKELAEYPGFDPWYGEKEPLSPRREYSDLKSAFARRMKIDDLQLAVTRRLCH